MLQLVVLIAFPALMVFAAFSDLFTMTISNRVSFALVLIFLPLSFAVGLSPAAIALHLVCGFGVLLITFAMFTKGWIGGGDAKLAAATAVWMGWTHLGDYGLDSAIVGGALTLAILLARQCPLPRWGLRFGWLMHLHDQRTGIPYGIALAVGGLLIYPETMIWSVLTSS